MRRIWSFVGAVVLAGGVLFAPGGAAAATASADPDVIAGSWIVQLAPGVDARSEAPGMARRAGGRVGNVYGAALNGFSFKGSERAAANLSRNPRVLRVEADRVLRALGTVPTGVVRVDARHADGTREVTSSAGSGVRVAVLDTGVDATHAEFGGRVVAGRACIETSSTTDGNGHGTHVAGTVAGSSVGVAPAATIVAVKVLDSSGSGSWDSVICGINYVTDLNGDTDPANNVRVANMSLGGQSSESATSCSSSTLHQAICNSVNAGATYTVAAGNDGRDASGYVPAKYPSVLTVSAFSDLDGARDPGDTSHCVGSARWKDCDETFARFSNYGSIVDVMAPGVRIYSSVPGGGYDTYSGTSMAAPHVAGVAALVLEDNALSVLDLETRLEATGECPGATFPGTGVCSGSWSGDSESRAEPMVNAARAVSGTSGGGGTTNTAPTAYGQTVTVASGATTTITLRGTDPEQCDLTFALSKGSHTDQGCVAGTPNTDTATVSYTAPVTTTDTTDSFTFTVHDGVATSPSATVTINVTGSGSGTTATSSAVSATAFKYGGKFNDNHVDITFTVVDNLGGAVPGAAVTAQIVSTSRTIELGTGTTDSAGKVVFSLKNYPSGTWTTDVTNVVATPPWGGGETNVTFTKS